MTIVKACKFRILILFAGFLLFIFCQNDIVYILRNQVGKYTSGHSLSYTILIGGSGMDFFSEGYEIVEGKIRDLQEQRKVLVDLVVELFRQVEDLEKKLDELYRSCEGEKWF